MQKPPSTPRPPAATNEIGRRAMLEWLIEYNGGMNAVAKNSGLTRQTLRRYVRGRTKSVTALDEKDLSITSMTPPKLGQLLDAFSLTDAQARELFGLPADEYPHWLTHRPYPVGSAAAIPADVPRTYQVELAEPLLAPRGMTLELAQLDQPIAGDPWVVVKLGEARYVLRHAAVPPNLPIEGRLISLR